MRIRSLRRFAVPLCTVALLAAGCGANDSGAPEGAVAELGTVNDINPHDVSELRDGGNLRLAATSYPEHWNPLQIDSDGESAGIMRPMLPRAFATDAAGAISVNTDFFTGVELTNTEPQQVTYTINPKAVWSDGTPITWEDIASQANAMSGKDPKFLIGNTNGFDRIEKVERGTDDRQAIITFTSHYADWAGQFSGNSMLLPKEATATPEAFNEAWRNAPGKTSGPFVIQSTDRGQGRIVLGRNPKWWGATPKLDTITFSVLSSEAMVPALANNEIDAIGLATRDDMQTARSTPGVAIRRAPGNSWSHLTFNGAPGSLLEDPKLRVAIIKAIDRAGIAKAMQNGLVVDPQPLNNHIFIQGQKGYQDNSLPFDPEAAKQELDALGWTLNGDVREKNGRKLVIRDVMYNDKTWVQVAQIIQQNLRQVGIELAIETKPGSGFFTDNIQPGNFDVGQWVWMGDAFPLSSIPQIWGYYPDNLQGNYGRIGSPELNDLIEKTLTELDPQKAIELANQVDQAVWAEGHSIPLVQSAGNIGVRDNLANYGAAGLASLDYTKIGFLK
ncbi:ABC transporter family substrate-binding protein [Nocardia zapadnayensis]|uniref:ABC transporter family substrate-binding protein n=1 Tax=Nocardia rhamnosiphila TaxID=426716 RepID=UPI0022474B80|nr:ABC transporter family substrate-binding protein [Nocardia zapadnayensis]MCX0270217.1 ABC transporter family substrate-binding protein [Nocardia zapadnayensis]